MMRAMPLVARVRVADEIRALGPPCVEAVSLSFLLDNPDWHASLGAQALQQAVAAGRSYLEFLAAAVETGSIASFESYTRWAAERAAVRGIPPFVIARHLDQIGSELDRQLAEPARPTAAEFLEAGAWAARAAGRPAPPEAADWPPACEVFMDSVLRGDAATAAAALRSAVRRLGPSEAYATVVEAVMVEVGRRWQTGILTVAQEHLCTATVQRALARLYPELPRVRELRGRMVVAGVGGERHQLGPNVVADVLEGEGWAVTFLGSDVPDEDLVGLVREQRADVVGISATLLTALPAVRGVIARLRREVGTTVPILLGGAAFRDAGSFAQELGVLGYAADVRRAVQLLDH